MLKKGSKLYSIVNNKCPHCNEGQFFLSHPYNFKLLGETHQCCPECDRKYSLEPGFYYGAMYVSYGLAVGTFVAVWVAMEVLFPGASLITTVSVISGTILLAGPFLYHLSKLIWANLFIKFKGPATAEEPAGPAGGLAESAKRKAEA